MLKLLHRIWFPKTNDFLVWIICSPLFFSIGMLLHIIDLSLTKSIAEYLWICPLIIAGFLNIRRAQTKRIEKIIIDQHFKEKIISCKVYWGIGLFMFLLICLFLSAFVNNFFWFVIGLIILIGLFYLVADYRNYFIVLGIVFIIFYLLIVCCFDNRIPIAIILFLSIMLLPAAIAEIVFLKRIFMESKNYEIHN